MVDLKVILNQYPNCISSRSSFKSVLMDKYPSEKRQINILTILFECGIANKIKTKKTIDANDMQALITQVKNEYGISEEFSQDAILVWANAFEVKTVNIHQTKQCVLPLNNVAPTATDWEYVDFGNNTIELVAHKGKLPARIVFPVSIDNKKVISIGSTIFGETKSKSAERTGVESIVIPQGVERIENSAFSGCKALKDISLPEGLESIGENAFKNCKALSTVSFPKSIHFLGNGAFAGSGIKSIVLPGSIGVISKETFKNCKQLANVVILSGISSIQSEAFSGCKSIISISLPDGTTSIESMAFYECKGLNRVVIPDSVSYIGYRAFEWCAELTSIQLPRNLRELKNGVFDCCGFNSFNIPEGIEQIDEDAFANCWSLSRITIPKSVSKIDRDAFFNVLSDIQIVCYRDSYAHKWASSHKAKFELID